MRDPIVLQRSQKRSPTFECFSGMDYICTAICSSRRKLAVQGIFCYGRVRVCRVLFISGSSEDEFLEFAYFRCESPILVYRR